MPIVWGKAKNFWINGDWRRRSKPDTAPYGTPPAVTPSSSLLVKINTLPAATQKLLRHQLNVTLQVAAKYPTVKDAEKGGYRRARQGQERKDGQIVIGQLRPRRTFRASVLASRVLSGLLEFAL